MSAETNVSNGTRFNSGVKIHGPNEGVTPAERLQRRDGIMLTLGAPLAPDITAIIPNSGIGGLVVESFSPGEDPEQSRWTGSGCESECVLSCRQSPSPNVGERSLSSLGGDGSSMDVTILGDLMGRGLGTGTVFSERGSETAGRCCPSKPCGSDEFKEC